MCTTTTHWATHISSECSLGGTAQCDGTCQEHQHECTCSCHGEWDLPLSTASVRDWHDEREGVASSFVIDYPEGNDEIAAAWYKGQDFADRLNAMGDKHYAVRQGQGRIVVVEDYR